MARAARLARPAPDARAGPQVLPLDLLPDARRDPDRDRNRRARVPRRRAARVARTGALTPAVARGGARDARARACSDLLRPGYNGRALALVAELVDALG